MAQIAFDHVDKVYQGGVKALDDLDLQVEEGEFMVLVGPSGCGKSNLAFGLKLRRTPKSEIKRRVGQAAKMLGLEPYLGRKPAALSGGQRQRGAMGRAIVREPQAFLMDEPLSNLDAKLRVSMRAALNQPVPRPGQQLELAVDTRRLHFFDPPAASPSTTRSTRAPKPANPTQRGKDRSASSWHPAHSVDRPDPRHPDRGLTRRPPPRRQVRSHLPAGG
jgi:ABC-type molybdenum transport system ATPase subunit/photorepair protein PhrA